MKSGIRKRYWLASIALGICAIFLITFSSRSTGVVLQQLFFKDLKSICVSSIQLQMGKDWLVELVDEGKDKWPKLFNLIPIPRNLSNGARPTPMVILWHAKSDTEVSIAFNAEAPRHQESIKACAESNGCRPIRVKFENETFDASQFGSEKNSVTLIQPLKVYVLAPLRGIDGFQDIRVASCRDH
jgi:hypothetical protein